MKSTISDTPFSYLMTSMKRDISYLFWSPVLDIDFFVVWWLLFSLLFQKIMFYAIPWFITKWLWKMLLLSSLCSLTAVYITVYVGHRFHRHWFHYSCCNGKKQNKKTQPQKQVAKPSFAFLEKKIISIKKH